MEHDVNNKKTTVSLRMKPRGSKRVGEKKKLKVITLI